MWKGGIAFFDSGIGGLTVLAECRRRIPMENFYYYGDNTHAPYGNLSKDKIRRYVLAAFRKFKRWKVGAVVVACNTATALCVEELRKKFSFPIVGIEPAVRPASALGGEVFVLSTRATYESARYRALLQKTKKEFPAAKIRAFACDGLAGAIEKNLTKEGADFSMYLPRGSPSSVVLGCTHYSFIAEQIQRFYGCRVFDGNYGVAARLQELLQRKKNARPPMTPQGQNRGLFLSKSTAKTSSRSGVGGEMNASQKGRIFFLGTGKVVNETVYEQMFVSKVGKKG